MARILLLPLDERPCNFNYPSMITKECTDVELIMPPRSILGNKKQPADLDAINRWLEESFSTCDYAVLSVDMLVYGGIVPSRIHHCTEEQCLHRLAMIEKLHAVYPQVKIYAFNLIMRAPSYSSSEEEPDYYALYGDQLYRLGVLKDKLNRKVADETTQAEQSKLEKAVPGSVVSDFCNRRNINHQVNLHVISLLEKRVLDFLVVPLDDCAPYGWAASEQQLLRRTIMKKGVGESAYIYSGADEVGCVLLARAVNASRQYVPAVWMHFSSVIGPLITPKYEDRPLGENLKWQIAAAGGRCASAPDSADLILMVNAPTIGGDRMADVNLGPDSMDPSYFSCRCLPDFISSIRDALQSKPVLLADLALSNGADHELMQMLGKERILQKLSSYSGWNTAANAAGTCIAHGMICYDSFDKGALFTSHRILEDWLYMSCIRSRAAEYSEKLDGAFDDKEANAALASFIQKEMTERLQSITLPADVIMQGIHFPWNRLFEIELLIDRASF